MIKTFANKETAAVYCGERPRRLPSEMIPIALRKLAQLDVVQSMVELSIPPGNRLEKLSGDRKGQYSIRINDQWRICFRFAEGHAYDVEIVDYH
jgi:proteic killer suppression protein